MLTDKLTLSKFNALSKGDYDLNI